MAEAQQANHGLFCMSTCIRIHPDLFMGTAPDASPSTASLAGGGPTERRPEWHAVTDVEADDDIGSAATSAVPVRMRLMGSMVPFTVTDVDVEAEYSQLIATLPEVAPDAVIALGARLTQAGCASITPEPSITPKSPLPRQQPQSPSPPPQQQPQPPQPAHSPPYRKRDSVAPRCASNWGNIRTAVTIGGTRRASTMPEDGEEGDRRRSVPRTRNLSSGYCRRGSSDEVPSNGLGRVVG